MAGWAAVQAIAMLVSAASAASVAGQENTSNTENAAAPGGDPGAAGTGPLNSSGPSGVGDILSTLGTGGQGGLPNIVDTAQGAQTAAAGVAAGSQVAPSTPGLTPPGQEGVDPKAPVAAPEVDIGTILAQIPQAIAAAGNLLGGDDSQHTQRPAPIAGGSGGQVVGQFNRPIGQQPNIGQLLAALPGLR